MNKAFFQNKKGFTLVELMIVVVIMGILVAVAIPVYGAVTTNAERKTCHANCRIIQETAVNYFLAESTSIDYKVLLNGSATATVASAADATSKLAPKFVSSFEGGKFPECPTDGCSYQLTAVDGDPGELRVVCSEHGDKEGNFPS